ncbi:hypothetical protein F2Q69_00044370 [Brassica cretica]|uniref:non-specific serine/threonine protein kinase n=1 Tax=Brassica cretica TaxID=69181 RepID=A0A8S9NL53_BRACR|nr:hypothetical protein F2Q69_00044370 [Brassica cretica]
MLSHAASHAVSNSFACWSCGKVLNDQGYDGATADLWSCGVILFVLLAGYLPFDESNLMTLYKKITAAEYTCPPWLSLGAKKLIVRILDPNPVTRISIQEILEDAWFKKNYKRPVFEEKEEANLDDVEAVFKDSEEHHVTEKKEEQPTSMNAFELISMSRALDLGNLFEEEEGYKRETRFAATGAANELVQKIEEASKPLGFDIQKKNYKMRLENVNAGRKGNLKVATEVKIGYQDRVKELMEQGLEEEQLKNKMELVKDSYTILSSVEERRMYDWSLARSEKAERYIWPFEVDIMEPSREEPPPQEPEDVGPTRILGYFIGAWLVLGVALSVALNR